MSIEKNYMAKVAMNKSVLKEFHSGTNDRLVYLNDGDEFQICLFNPETFAVGAEISINGEAENGVIVVRPGERIWIERPLGKQKKYKFETYTVEDSEETANAIKNNGEIKIRFYKEKRREAYKPITKGFTKFDNINISADDANIYFGLYGSSNNLLNSDATTINTNVCRSLFNSTTSTFGSNNIRCKTSVDNNNMLTNINATVNSISTTVDDGHPAKTSIETGRISTGNYSSQEFKTVDIDFELFAYETEIIKILPMSRKPYTSSDLQKVYCTECGRKLNPKFKFCPYCGNKCQFYQE